MPSNVVVISFFTNFLYATMRDPLIAPNFQAYVKTIEGEYATNKVHAYFVR